MVGFQTDFLGSTPDFTINLPDFNNASYTLVDYTHYSVYQNINRKLAQYCACNINQKYPGIDRRSFRKDLQNLKADEQLGDEFYKSVTFDHPTRKNANVFDRGHIISKQYPQ
ncbi:MAG: hypothetical protein V7767_07645 [Leeuwenhoekiella sp.]